MDEIGSLINGLAQGAGMVAVFAVYLDRRLLSIEQAINRMAEVMKPKERVDL